LHVDALESAKQASQANRLASHTAEAFQKTALVAADQRAFGLML